MRRAFTLLEVLTVTAIMAVLALVLFPVFTAARQAAKRSHCVSNFHQVTLATNLYLIDYDDRFMPAAHSPMALHDAKQDRTWVQTLLPYTRSFAPFQCPADHGVRPRPEGVFDQDLSPTDTYERFYEASMRSDIGFNYLYLSPVVKDGDEWQAEPKFISQVETHTQTILFSDSVWARNERGLPYGGGNYLIVPPCRFEQVGTSRLDTFQTSRGRAQFFTVTEGWQEEPSSAYVFGGAWPWHAGRMNVARVDGSVTTLTPTQLSAGCDVRDSWQGLIEDSGAYVWDLK